MWIQSRWRALKARKRVLKLIDERASQVKSNPELKGFEIFRPEEYWEKVSGAFKYSDKHREVNNIKY